MTTITLSAVIFFSLSHAPGGTGDFYRALANYEKDNLEIARSFFEEFISEQPGSVLTPDARYYLVRIYRDKGDALRVLEQGFRYLDLHVYGPHRQEIFDIVLRTLSNGRAYALALDCLEKYDYIACDSSLRRDICLDLTAQPQYSDRAWPLCPRQDTFLALRALAVAEPAEKEKLYSRMSGIKGDLYLCEFFLGRGDTLKAYDRYRKIVLDSARLSAPPPVVYRLARLSRLFDAAQFAVQISALSAGGDFSRKAKLLKALETGVLDERIAPADAEEAGLLLQYHGLDTVAAGLPGDVDRELLLADTSVLLRNVQALRKKYGDVFSLDSIHAELLIGRNLYQEAYDLVSKYARFVNAKQYVRRIKAFADYHARRYDRALTAAILMQTSDPGLLYIAARCSEQLGKDPADLYAKVTELAVDTLLKRTAFAGYLKNAYEHGRYRLIAGYAPGYFTDDEGLLRIYLCSLARTGHKTKADSLLRAAPSAQAADFMKEYAAAYGSYLIDGRKYDRAISYYDSVIQSFPEYRSGQAYYELALSFFMKQDYAAAESLFGLILSKYGGDRSCAAAFKIATIKYMDGDFDSAAYYYGFASADTALTVDALRNRVVVSKKSENWKDVIAAGKKLVNLEGGEDDHEVMFEIGYACLRGGETRPAIEFFQRAIAIKSTPEYHYWLAETHLGRGDFIRALYHYQTIVTAFARDEMWAPTAEFKSGLALEFLDAAGEARALYRSILRKRGPADVWGAEAKKRLEMME